MTDLPPGRQLDALIAERVRKITKGKVYGPRGGHIGWSNESGFHEYNLKKIWPPYSTQLVFAWDVINDLKFENWEVMLETYAGQWEVQFEKDEQIYRSEAATAPHAICLAALKAIDGQGTP